MARTKTQMTAEAAARIQANQKKGGKDDGFAARAKAAAMRNARAAQTHNAQADQSGQQRHYSSGYGQQRSS
ncbi:hypothetical protein PFICI_09068 [Pestalotiopsis fici W106-1]|uniref:SMP domain-containing protein n=1 Tax=Pestalotiopsis fici (strain W106-1 / CGMCC3.15140) TaxID=1229662 RepID=W3WZD9_PESFW|nr:uncharacterized protein PFICI_09068 [Pestalotiopsis fici W106-1]ETS79215.1 hypothetical protein PFICI_09068 [Pestalotiopsis fici W106-1]